MTRMPFGKFKGEDLEDVPTSYLVFVAEQCSDVDDGLLWEVRQEVAKRYPNPLALPVIDRAYLVDWFRRASFEAHPDVGGSVGMMKLINELRERL